MMTAVFLWLTVAFPYVAWLFLGIFGGQARIPGGKDSYAPKVSIVVACYNEEATIEQKIQNLLSLEYDHTKMEIVFVDSSTDKTRGILRQFCETRKERTILIMSERKGLAHALNAGYSAAHGDIVVKSDADMILDRNAIRRLVDHFADPKVGAVSGSVRPREFSNVEAGYRSIFDRIRSAESNLDSTYIFNWFGFRRELFARIDPRSVADEAEIAINIRKRGFRTVYACDAIAYESFPRSAIARIRIRSRRAQGHIQIALKNTDLLFNRNMGLFGLVVFPTNFFMVVISPWLILLTMALTFVELYVVNSVFSLAFLAACIGGMTIIYARGIPRILSGFLDSQIALLIGGTRLLFRGPDFAWKRVR